MVKLLEVISYNDYEIVNEEETPDASRRPPVGTIMSAGGNTYEFKGAMWVKINSDGSDGRPASRDIRAELDAQWDEVRRNPAGSADDMESARRGRVNVEARAALWTSNNTNHFVKVGSHAFKFDTEDAAKDFMRTWNRGNSTVRTDMLEQFGNRRVGAGTRFAEGWRSAGFQSIDEAIDRMPFVRTILANRFVQSVFKVFEVFGWSTLLLQTHVVNVAYWKDLADKGELTQQEAEDLIMSSQAAFGAQVTVLLLAMFRSGRQIRLFLSGARVITNMWAAVAASTGVGIPGALALIAARETAFFLVQYLLTRPAIQRKLAETISSFLDYTIIRFAVESLAGITGAGLGVASRALDDIGLGFENLIRDGGWEYTPKDQEDVTQAFASTEWAKLIFQDVLFPPDRNFEVPYIATGERRRLLQSKLGSMFRITFESQSDAELGTPSNPKPMSSQQLGQLRDHVFVFSSTEYERLKDTHEVVAISDVMGQRPGGSNEMTFLAPTPEALASGQPLPEPDNVLFTSSGQMIERPAPQDASGDNIVRIAQDAIDSVPADPSTSPRRGYESGQDTQQELPSYLQRGNDVSAMRNAQANADAYGDMGDDMPRLAGPDTIVGRTISRNQRRR